MVNLANIGRIFYGIAITEIGLQTIYDRDFPYIVPFPDHFSASAHVVLAIAWGILFSLAGACIILKKQARKISLLFGAVLVCICCLYYIPYVFLTNPNYLHFDEWENAEKELALAGGAFVIAGYFSNRNENRFFRFLEKFIPLGAVVFAITIISFGILHFLEAADAATLVPSWIPNHMFWIYFAGIALIGSGLAIILKIRVGLIAALLGLMIFLWFILLHIPRIIASPVAYLGAEITSAFLALAYSGTAFVIAGEGKKIVLK